MTSRLGRYGFAALMVLLGTVGLALFDRLFDVERAPFLLYAPSVLAAAMVGGFGPGILATLLGSVAVETVLLTENGRAAFPDVGRLAIFVAVGTGISVMARRLKDARSLAEQRAVLANARADELAAARADAERHAREADRRAAELEALFNVSPVGIARADTPDCAPINVNQSLAVRLGLPGSDASVSERPGETPPVRVTTLEGAPLSSHELPMQTAVRTRAPVLGAEFNVVRQDGRVVTLVGHAVPLFDEQHAVRGALGVFTDVTDDRRRANEQRFLAEASRLLSGSLDYEETLRGFASLAVPAMADWAVLEVEDERGGTRRVASVHHTDEARVETPGTVDLPYDPAVRLMRVGRQPLVVPVLSDDVLAGFGASPDTVAAVRRLGFASALAVPLTIQGAFIGAVAWMRGAGRPPFDERDLALAEDVARRAAQALDHSRLYREAQSANRLKDEFVATLSHELRTPLNVLLGWTELLRAGLLPPERQRDAIEAVHRAATAQAQITNDLVDVSRAVSGKFQLAPREVEVAPLVQAACGVFRHAAESKGLWLRCEVDASLPRVHADPDRLQQVVYNLVGNAVKFTTHGGVDVTATLAGDWLELAVRDTGIGIDPGFLPYVFDRFRQADGRVTREYGGLGLGLSIVRAIVELHGGTVSAKSPGLGQGATFTVRVPAAARLSAPAGVNGGAKAPEGAPASRSSPRST